jgi:hypothetical protein
MTLARLAYPSPPPLSPEYRGEGGETFHVLLGFHLCSRQSVERGGQSSSALAKSHTPKQRPGLQEYLPAPATRFRDPLPITGCPRN